jgi:hypothetical protein
MYFQVSNLVKEQIWSLPLLGTHQCIQGDACCCLVQYCLLCETQPVLVHCSAPLCLLFVVAWCPLVLLLHQVLLLSYIAAQ